MSQPHIVFSIRHLAQRLDRDPRTTAAKLGTLNLMPFAVAVDGTAFYLESTLIKLAEDALQHEVEP